jgi:hypothetical protein
MKTSNLMNDLNKIITIPISSLYMDPANKSQDDLSYLFSFILTSLSAVIRQIRVIRVPLRAAA